MKNIKIASAVLFLLIALSCNTNAQDPVLDSAGNPLKVEERYFILQRDRGPLLGLNLGNTRGMFCPRSVVRVNYDPEIPSNNDGLPVAITPVNATDGIIRVSTDVNIQFWTTPVCQESTVWKVDKRDNTTGRYFIIAGGVVGNPGRETINNWFKIEKLDNDYKLVYCPSVCKECRPMCQDIGLYYEGDQPRLALSDSPLRVLFKWA